VTEGESEANNSRDISDEEEEEPMSVDQFGAGLHESNLAELSPRNHKTSPSEDFDRPHDDDFNGRHDDDFDRRHDDEFSAGIESSMTVQEETYPKVRQAEAASETGNRSAASMTMDIVLHLPDGDQFKQELVVEGNPLNLVLSFL